MGTATDPEPDEDDGTRIFCQFCLDSQPDEQAACDAGWIPSFWDVDSMGDSVREGVLSEPVCPECQAKYLRLASDGEMELKP